MPRIKARSIILISCLFLAFPCGGCFRQPAKASDGELAAARASEEANVKKALDDFYHAVSVKDWKAVEGLLAQDFEFYTDDSTVVGRDEYINAMKGDDMKIAKLELKNVKVNLSPDSQMAWIKYSALLESQVNGAPYNMMSAETVALRKEGAQWKLTHSHASIKNLANKSAS